MMWVLLERRRQSGRPAGALLISVVNLSLELVTSVKEMLPSCSVD